MAANARTLIQDALDDLTVLTEGVEVTPSEMQKALRRLNRWRESLLVSRGAMYEVVETITALVGTGAAGFTIGTGGTINIVRPTWIDHAAILLSGATNKTALNPLSDQDYQTWGGPVTGVPYDWWFDHRWDSNGRGTVHLLPAPASGYAFSLLTYTPGVPVAAFANLDTEYSFSLGYERFIQKNLALELAPMFKATPSRELVQQAVDSREALINSNVRPERRRSDPALVGCGGNFDIESGRYR